MSRRGADQSASQARPRHAAGEDAERPSEGQEGYWAYMQRQINERTEKLGMVGESMDHLQERSASWAKDVNKYVNQKKRNVLLGGKVPRPLIPRRKLRLTRIVLRLKLQASRVNLDCDGRPPKELNGLLCLSTFAYCTEFSMSKIQSRL
jgi:hypothetical protein